MVSVSHRQRFDFTNWSVSTPHRQARLTYRTDFLRPGVLSGGLRLFHSKYDASSFAITAIDFEERLIPPKPFGLQASRMGDRKSSVQLLARSPTSHRRQQYLFVGGCQFLCRRRSGANAEAFTKVFPPLARCEPCSCRTRPHCFGRTTPRAIPAGLLSTKAKRIWANGTPSFFKLDLKKHFMLFQFHASLVSTREIFSINLCQAREACDTRSILPPGTTVIVFAHRVLYSSLRAARVFGQGMKLNLVPFLDFGETLSRIQSFGSRTKPFSGLVWAFSFPFPRGNLAH